MKRIIALCVIVIYFVTLPLWAPFIFGAMLGFSGTLVQRLVFLSILILPWLPVAAWVIVHLRRRN